MLDILVGHNQFGDSFEFDEKENGRMKKGEHPMIPKFVPIFVQYLIENGLSQDRSIRRSFKDMTEVMEKNQFEFVEGADICAVLDFVDLVGRSSF
jgi:hypothetical protein